MCFEPPPDGLHIHRIVHLEDVPSPETRIDGLTMCRSRASHPVATRCAVRIDTADCLGVDSPSIILELMPHGPTSVVPNMLRNKQMCC